MKKALLFLLLPFLLIILVVMIVGGIINSMTGGATVIVAENQESISSVCKYTTEHITFNKETESKRKTFETMLNKHYVNIAMAIYQTERTMSENDVIDEIVSWDLSYGIEANVQDFKYEHKYLPYLKSINAEHSLSNSKRYFQEHYKGKAKEYRYYIDVMSIIDKSCGIQVNGKFTAPLEFPFIITQDFGVKHIYGDLHYGIDLVKGFGANVYAVTDGVIHSVGTGCPVDGGYLGNMCNGGQGNYVQIVVKDEKNTFYIETMHMKDIYVKQGEAVTAGQTIGTQGNSGNSTGSHVHLEIRKIESLSSDIKDFIDPHELIDFFEKTKERE